MTLVPAPRPCISCPYRQDIPSGVWDESEYAKLERYDAETAYQPPGAFFCHQQDGRLCAGWVAVHDMDESLGLRLYASLHLVTAGEYEAILDYETPVPLFGSGTEAAVHGREEIEDPGPAARGLIAKLNRRIEAPRGTSSGEHL